MKLTEDEVIQIIKLIEESKFDELHLEMGDLKLIVRKGGPASVGPAQITVTAPPESIVSQKPAGEVKEQKAERTVQKIGPQPTAVSEEGIVPVTEEEVASIPEGGVAPVPEEGLVPIKSPMLGTFYRRPAPGEAPYVEVGAFVKEDDTVCLVEVMKVFNAVKAGMQGYITKVCAESGELVEYGQTLFLVKPDENVKKKKKKKA